MNQVLVIRNAVLFFNFNATLMHRILCICKMNYDSNTNAEVSDRIIKNVFFRAYLASLQLVKFELEIGIHMNGTNRFS